jgi:hypothetical protein
MLTVAIIQIPELRLGHIADALNQVFLIFPNYALGMGVVQLSTNFQFTRDCSKFSLEFICPAFPDTFCCAKRKEFKKLDSLKSRILKIYFVFQ